MKNDDLALEVNNLTVRYDVAPVLFDLNFSVSKGSVTGVLGPNGSGKTTLLKCLLDRLKPDSGRAIFFGFEYKNVKKRVAYVPQKSMVDWSFPITVLDVVLMGRLEGLGFFQFPKHSDKQKAKEALATLGLEGYEQAQISELSEGQKQRVFLARALVEEADLYLLDEPFTGVDAATEVTILELIQKLKAEGKTFVIVHHDLQNVRKIFDHLILIRHSLIAEGPPKKVLTKSHLKLAFGEKSDLLSEMIEISESQKAGAV